jgi:acyl CoA:acetate/3-ketoacid CoA transferase
VLDQAEFPLRVADDLKLTPAAVLRPEPMGLTMAAVGHG